MKARTPCSTLRLILALLVLAVVMLSCADEPTPTPTDTPAPTPTSTATVPIQVAEDTPTRAIPTATPAPPTDTPIPLPPHNPVVIYRMPAPGEELRLGAPIRISFDQAMDRGSVEAAFKIEPAVPGQLFWEENTLVFDPAADALTRDAVYRVVIDEQAKSVEGRPLQDTAHFRIRTVGYLEVTNVQPPPDAVEIATDARVLVAFNRPVVPLTGVSDQASLPQPILFSPPVAGRGEWLNTSIYAFQPAEGFAPSTTYEARIPAGLQDTTGGELAQDYVWAFTTKLPAVVETAPFNGAQYVSPTETIRVTFNQPMDRASVEAAFALWDRAGQSVPGAFRWEGDETLLFAPQAPLELGARYSGQIQAGARAAGGLRGTERPYSWQFTIVQAPRITRTNPANGQRNADPYTGLQVTFSSPMDRTTLLDNLTIIPEPTQVYSSWSRSETELWLSFGAQPSSSYQVTFGADLAGRYGHKLGTSYTISFATRALNPDVYLSTPSRIGTYNAYTETVVLVNHTNVPEITAALYAMTRAEFESLNTGDWWRVWDKYTPDPSTLLRRWSVPSQGELNQRTTSRLPIALERGGTLPPGLYYLEVSGTGAQYTSRHMMVVSHTNLVVKHGEREVLVWATDLRSGEPLPGVALSIAWPKLDEVRGVTGQDGVFRAQVPPHDPWETFMVWATRGDESTVALSDWNYGIEQWQFGLGWYWGQSPYRGVIYSDRPIYRPGQKVYFKGIVRADDDGHYTIPPWQEIQVYVIDAQGKELLRGALPLNDFGTFDGELTLAEEAALGGYYIEATVEGENLYISHGFQVAEYRRPEFQVQVTTDRDDYVQGDTVSVHVDASYFFGGPVRDAQVRWNLMSQDYYFYWPEGDGWWDFNDLDLDRWEEPQTPYGRLVSEGRGRTDAQGQFTFQLAADVGTRKMSQVFTMEAVVVDANNQEVASRTSAIVHKGLFYIGLQPQAYVGTAGKEMGVNIVTLDPQGEMVPNVPLEVAFYEYRWYSVRERDSDGAMRWVSKAEDTLVATAQVVTDGSGRAVASFVPEKGGVYRIRAMGRDQRGNEISASTFTWVSGQEFTPWRMENHNRIDLVPDKKSYAPGDVAHILIPSPFQGETTVLLTIERGRILEHRVIELQGNSEQVAVPITSDHIPNIFVSALIIKGEDATNPLASFRLGYASLPVSPQEKELRISITPDQDVYHPGDTATYAIQATDHLGRPVSAEVSLALVDLSVLTLSADQGPDLMQRFYQERGLGIQTASTLAISVDEYTKGMADEARAKGGDGGGLEGMTVRRDFPDTVYWNPTLRTDAQGQAQVEVKLADNLTTWRMRAQGITLDTQVGKGEQDVIATKALLIRPVTPRFFVVGDRVQLAAVVHNNTDTDLDVLIALQATGLTVEDAAQRATVPAHGLVRATWWASVSADEEAELIFSVSGGGLSDAALPVFGVLPIYRYITPETVATAGQVAEGDRRVEVVQLPAHADPDEGDLQLRLEPSLAAGMRQGLEYLKTYPYDCIEQTVSRFLPNVITYRALRELGIRNEELEAELPDHVSKGLQRLYAMQQGNGGWGWWLSDESDPYITAYVVMGLNEAQRAGFAVDAGVLDRAVAFVERSLDQRLDVAGGYPANARAFVLYVLADHYSTNPGTGDLGRAVALYERRDILDHYGKAYLALALHLMAPDERARLDALVSDLSSAAIQSATGAHWEEAQRDHRAMNTDTRSTAIVLRALVAMDPDHPLVPAAVRWLMTARRQGRWESTQETAWSIMALTDYMVVSGELQGNYDYRVLLNGQVWDEGRVSPDTLESPRELRAAVAELLRETGNQVWLERESGPGQLYYSLYLRYALPVEEVEALSRGVVVSRQYSLLDNPGEPVSGAQVGDVIQVKLTLIAPHDLYYLVVEDPLPAGCEAVDVSLQTTSAVYQSPQLEPQEKEGRPYYWGYWSHSELRDEKVALFATRLPKGTYEYTYLMRASIPGQFAAMPAYAYEMYFPEVFGRSDGSLFDVAEE